jgi:hypothetical protein
MDIMSRRTPNILLIELNEFSIELFQRGITELALPNIKRLLAMRQSRTLTDDKVEHRGLDPWVQWVSTHTGVPSSVHRIMHLGDAPSKLGLSQLWEVLSQKGISSGVWGAMNATRGNAPQCAFFLPDPWTFEEPAFPKPLGDLLALPRYYSKNYLDVSKKKFLINGLRLARYVLGSPALFKIIGLAPFILKGILRNGINNAMLFSLFDLFSTAIFLEQRKRHQPQLSLIFLNSIAHLQHHRWEVGAKLSGDLQFGLQAIDRALGMLFASRKDGEALVVMNALTQRNIAHEKPRILYRQINPSRFLSSVGIKFKLVEQLMTNDAHVFFESNEDRDEASRILEKVVIGDTRMFHVEASRADPLRLFYQIDFWDELEPHLQLLVNDQTILFSDHFEAIVARTGAHIPEGDVFVDGLELPSELYNHEISTYLIQFLDKKESELIVN